MIVRKLSSVSAIRRINPECFWVQAHCRSTAEALIPHLISSLLKSIQADFTMTYKNASLTLSSFDKSNINSKPQEVVISSTKIVTIKKSDKQQLLISTWRSRKPCQLPRWNMPWAFAVPLYTRIKPCATAAADLQHPPEEFRVKSTNQRLCSGKTGRTSLWIVRYF